VLRSQTYKGNQETKQKIEKKIGSSSLRALTKNVVGLFHPHLMKKRPASQPIDPESAQGSDVDGGIERGPALAGSLSFIISPNPVICTIRLIRGKNGEEFSKKS
jgi:hypothetical protein